MCCLQDANFVTNLLQINKSIIFCFGGCITFVKDPGKGSFSTFYSCLMNFQNQGDMAAMSQWRIYLRGGRRVAITHPGFIKEYAFSYSV